MRQGSKPTIRDVAASAGVSLATVSYVLSGRAGGTSRISPPTQDRVHEAVRELSYVPNRAARGMRRGRTDVVAIAVVDLEEAPDRALAAAVARILPRHGYQPVILLGATWRQFLLSGGADGAILILRGEGAVEGAGASDAGTPAELAVRGVVRLVIPDALRHSGIDILLSGSGPVPGPGGTAGAPAGMEVLAERAVVLLLDRLHGTTPAEDRRSGVRG